MPSTSSFPIYGIICLLPHHDGCLNCVYQVTSNLHSFKFNEYFSFLIIDDSMWYGLSLGFLTTPTCLWLFFISFVGFFLSTYSSTINAVLTLPISLFVVSLVTLTAHMASVPYWRVLNHLFVLISKPRSTCSKLNSLSLPIPLQLFCFLSQRMVPPAIKLPKTEPQESFLILPYSGPHSISHLELCISLIAQSLLLLPWFTPS